MINYNPVTLGDIWDSYSTIDGQNTGVSLKEESSKLGGWYLYNNSNAIRYVKFYNKASVPDANDIPALVLAIPPGSGANQFTESGVKFNYGLGIRVVTGIAHNNNTGPTTNDVIVNIFYK